MELKVIHVVLGTILLNYYFYVPIKAAKILAYFPLPLISHHTVFRPLTQELARRGHELLVLTTDPAFPKESTPENLTEVDLHEKSYEIWHKGFIKYIDGNRDSAFNQLKLSFKVLVDLYESQLNTKELQDLIKSGQKFDLIMIEALARPALILSHIFKAPVIQISSFGSVPPNYQTFGAPSHPILYPELNRNRLYNLSLWEKIEGTFEDFRYRYMLWSMEELEDKMLKKNFGPNTPTVSELSNNVDMLFLNMNPIWEGNRPVPPGVIHLGGLHQQPNKELSAELKSYLDNSKHGVIYMSFGTNVDTTMLPAEKIEIFNKVFTELPYNILWKWNEDIMPGKANNVMISKWFPQSDILRHPKLKLFITQAGLQSSDEAITGGIPLIAFPMRADQWYNAEKYVQFGIGLKLDIQTITEEILKKSIECVIKNKWYHQNIAKLGEQMRDQPQTSLERAVWWTEYVIRHGGAKHLRSPAANISWAEYLMLDVVFIVFAMLIIFLLVIIIFMRLLIFFCGKSVKLKHN